VSGRQRVTTRSSDQPKTLHFCNRSERASAAMGTHPFGLSICSLTVMRSPSKGLWTIATYRSSGHRPSFLVMGHGDAGLEVSRPASPLYFGFRPCT
jgi:hypothetical protein